MAFVERRAAIVPEARRGPCARCGVTALLEAEHCHRCRRVIVRVLAFGTPEAPEPASAALLCWFGRISLVPAAVTCGVTLFAVAGGERIPGATPLIAWAVAHFIAILATLRGEPTGWTVWTASSLMLLVTGPGSEFPGPAGGLLGLAGLAILSWPSIRRTWRESSGADLPGWRAIAGAAVLALDAGILFRFRMADFGELPGWLWALACIALVLRASGLRAIGRGEPWGFVPALAVSGGQALMGAFLFVDPAIWRSATGYRGHGQEYVYATLLLAAGLGSVCALRAKRVDES